MTQVASPVRASLRLQARQMYWRGYNYREISRELEVPYTTVASWGKRDAWDESPVAQRIGAHLDARLCQLIAKPNKTNGEYKEIDQLMRQTERVARIEHYRDTGKPSHLNPRRSGNHIDKRTPKNQIGQDAIEKLKEAFEDSLFDYQRGWLQAKSHRIRNVIKSRQIGATWYFAREALIDAVTGGGNQIFLSASRAQAEVFRAYIVQFAREAADVELKGNPIVLPDGTGLYFLSTSSRTAQSYHGHIYMDEYFWIPRFAEFRKVASGMAMHRQWRQTYFSTPSSILHEAYAFWAGKGKKQDAEIDTTHAALQAGRVCEDAQWRQMVDVEDAIAGGCDLFDLEQLRQEYTEEDFANLLMCEFIDDTASVFGFDELLACGVDSIVLWKDFARSAPRPLKDGPVWLGYDPSRTRDNASLVIVAPPVVTGAPYRALEKYEWKHTDFVAQADAIRRITERYNVQFIGIDTTGIGMGVFDLVKNFYPGVTKINYSPEVKSRLVIRAKELVRSRRLQWDGGWNDLVRALLAIRRTTTASGNAVTFAAARSAQSGHADLGWALMHALEAQPLRAISDQSGSNQTSFMMIA